MIRVGVLALQGDFSAHINRLREIGISATEVRTICDLMPINGLILPGGESTTMLKLMEEESLTEAIRQTHIRHLCGRDSPSQTDSAPAPTFPPID